MGIEVEFNPDLCLRRFNTEGREPDECLPENLEPGRTYTFLKKGQRNYWFYGVIPLRETQGEGRLGRPLASIQIIEATHFRGLDNGTIYTRGRYEVVEVFNPDDETIKFEGFDRT